MSRRTPSPESGSTATVLLAVATVAAIAALVAGFVAWRIPDFDPAAPRVSARTTATEVRRHPALRRFLAARLDVEAITGLALTVAVAIVAAGIIATGLLLVMAQRNAGLARFDTSFARWGAAHATTTSTRVLRDVSLLGGTELTIAFSVIAATAVYVRTRTATVFAFLLTVQASQLIVMNLTKLAVGRPRPAIARLTGFSGSSFPSGHATAAAATYAAIALLVGRGRPRAHKAVLAAGAAGIAGAVATTRVLLGVHWFTDVLAGVAVGWACFAVASIAFGGRLLALGAPVAIAEAVAVADGADPPGRE